MRDAIILMQSDASDKSFFKMMALNVFNVTS